MPDEELPEWTTPLDEEILELLNTKMILTPSIIADNIDRSRGAISRRLNSLEAGGLVIKEERGKYRISKEGANIFEGGTEYIELSNEKRMEIAKEEYDQRMWIEEELGISESEYLSEVSKEVERLESEDTDEGEVLSRALKIVADEHR